MKAPHYTWTCHLCGASNSPNTNTCSRCHFAAVASAKDIAARKETLGPPTPAKPVTNRDLFLILAFGVYLIAGGTAAFTSGHWPIFLPPQLEVVGFVFNSLPKPFAGYISGVLLSGLGGILLVGVVAEVYKRKRETRKVVSRSQH